MLQATLISLVASILVSTLAVQVPLRSGQAMHHTYTLVDEDITEWKLDKLPNPDDTDHLVFETVHSLLQHWPNTRMRNGHNIVPGSVPMGTVLYHGRSMNELPSGPEWVSTDPEHSFPFCWFTANNFQQGCWVFTLVATRPLKVVYFDGSSAVKLPYGSLDTQDLIAMGRLGPHDISFEWRRIKELCTWGKGFGVDGFDGNGFIMLCDFASGIRVVSFVDLALRLENTSDMSQPLFFEVINAGSWHNHFPGETRIQLDLAGLVSFYDSQLAPSLIDIRTGQERWDHRVGNISTEDLLAVKSRLEANLMRQEGLSSGVDWRTLVQVIVDRYAQRLELMRYLLNSLATDSGELIDLANKTQTQLRVMLTPYLLSMATPIDPLDKTNLNWTIPIYKLCAMTHTHLMEFKLENMTDSEKFILKAVRGTSREICRVVIKMWVAGVYAGMDALLNTREFIDISEIRQLYTDWAGDLDDLMAWLDWNVWVKCSPGCGAEEMCYLPTWPVGFPQTKWVQGRGSPPASYPDRLHHERLSNFALRTMATEFITGELWSIIKPEPDEWIRPQPKCVRRIQPHEY